MRYEIEELRKSMNEAGMDAYYVPYGDFHCSEFVSDHFKVTEFLSGFTGESATLVVSGEGAWLWTDGRFFIQADKQLAGSGIEMMKIGEEEVPTPVEFIAKMAKEKAESGPSSGFVLGFDGRVVPASLKGKLEKAANAEEVSIIVKSDEDLAGRLWSDRPALEASEIWEFPLSSAGISAEKKIASVRDEMRIEGADYLLLSDLMETAWLFNLRGSDIEYTPVFYAFTLLSEDTVCLYVMDEGLAGRLGESLKGIEIKAYSDIYEDISSLTNVSVWLDSASCNYELVNRLGNDINIIDKTTATGMMKIVKNSTEITCSKIAHLKDGAAVTKLIKWLKDNINDREQGLTEISVVEKLHDLRSEQQGFIEESFETISAYGANAAIVHYAPNEETNAELRPEGLLLLDSGGQYIDGTTDITRTIALGSLTPEMIRDYTYTLKSHIVMAAFEVKDGLNGKDIDEASRKPLQDQGLDFNHGLSHGVGHVLGVHEGPNAVSKKDPAVDIKAGMIMSNEPGVYLEDQFGIRIENLVVWKETERGSLKCEPLTCVPYEREAIDVTLLTEEEEQWIDYYHEWVRDALSPLLDVDTASFLRELTAPLRSDR